MALTLRENICNARKLPSDPSVLAGRAQLLGREDCELVEAVLLRGQTVVSTAGLMGLSPRTVGNRVRKLAGRMSSRKFLDAARALRYLPGKEAALARLRFCVGLSERKLADKLGVSAHAVRRRLDRISAEIGMIRRMQKTWRGRGALEPFVQGD